MTGIALQLSASVVALGLMGGAVGVHYFKVREEVSALDESGLDDHVSLASYESELTPSFYETTGEFAALDRAPIAVKTEKELYLESFQQILLKFEQLNDENLMLREETVQLQEQVAETNRDLSQLQFRVDTHSESFRPLRLKEDSSYQKAGSAPSVLPPKNW
jgi:hypothetical protein